MGRDQVHGVLRGACAGRLVHGVLCAGCETPRPLIRSHRVATKWCMGFCHCPGRGWRLAAWAWRDVPVHRAFRRQAPDAPAADPEPWRGDEMVQGFWWRSQSGCRPARSGLGRLFWCMGCFLHGEPRRRLPMRGGRSAWSSRALRVASDRCSVGDAGCSANRLAAPAGTLGFAQDESPGRQDGRPLMPCSIGTPRRRGKRVPVRFRWVASSRRSAAHGLAWGGAPLRRLADGSGRVRRAFVAGACDGAVRRAFGARGGAVLVGSAGSGAGLVGHSASRRSPARGRRRLPARARMT